MDKKVQEVYDSMNYEQQKLLEYLVGKTYLDYKAKLKEKDKEIESLKKQVELLKHSNSAESIGGITDFFN